MDTRVVGSDDVRVVCYEDKDNLRARTLASTRRANQYTHRSPNCIEIG
jgi:hypothetical protein